MGKNEKSQDFQEEGGFEVDITMKREAIEDPFTEVPPADKMKVFLNQCVGPEAEPLVEEGDKVRYGEKIGGKEEQGEMLVPVHSPVNGTIEEIKKIRHPLSGEKENALIIKTEDAEEETTFEPIDVENASREELLKRVRDAGIVGLGGAAFPTHVKLSEKGISTLLINAKESDPNLASDVRLMMEKPEELIEGIKLMGKILDVDDIIFATRTAEGSTPKFEKLLRENDVEIERVRPNYSVGSEKLLVKEVLGKEVPSGEFPPSVGTVVHNVATAHAVEKAVLEGKSLVSRGITFYSEETGGQNLWVRMGTPIQHIFDFMDVSDHSFARVALGSIMMGPTVPDTSYPLLKATSGLTGFDRLDEYEREKPCIRCGYCNTVCPVDIYPQMIMKGAQKDDMKRLKNLDVLDCINCALCSYVCPSNIKLTPHLDKAQKKMREADD